MGNRIHLVQINENGELQIPSEAREALGLVAGTRLQVEVNRHGVRLRPAYDTPAKIYVEATNSCIIDCRTCIRNVWGEPLGFMPWDVYERILQGIQAYQPRPTIFFGGFGEPLVHPQLTEMVRRAKDTGASVELITNGILLTEDVAKQLIAAGLDMLWISIDGVTPESYADVRLGASLPSVLQNLDNLMRRRSLAETRKPMVGIAYVAMKRNIQDLPELISLGVIKGIERFSISNLLPHTQELSQEVMYDRSLVEGTYQPAYKYTDINLPRMDIDSQTIEAYRKALQGNYRFQLMGVEVEKSLNQCPFVLKGSISVRWDGAVSPCLALLHTHDSYLGKRLRRTQAYAFGSVTEQGLLEIWNSQRYIDLRQRLQEFDFPPCAYCNSCEMADSNQEDCFGNEAPTCGGCLWAQGLIQCP